MPLRKCEHRHDGPQLMRTALGRSRAEEIGSLKIWIDADAAPRDVKELVFRSAKRLAIEVVLVANQRLQTPPGNGLVSAVWVDGGPDVADQYIATHAAAGDLVVTQDVPLAAQLFPRRSRCSILAARSTRPKQSVSASRYATSWIRRDWLGSLREGHRPTMHGPSRPLPRRWTERLRACGEDDSRCAAKDADVRVMLDSALPIAQKAAADAFPELSNYLLYSMTPRVFKGDSSGLLAGAAAGTGVPSPPMAGGPERPVKIGAIVVSANIRDLERIARVFAFDDVAPYRFRDPTGSARPPGCPAWRG